MPQSTTRTGQSDAVIVRAATLQSVPLALSAFGLPLEPLLHEVGLPEDALAETENTVPVKAAVKLLALCAKRTERPDFGLLAGQKVPITALGLVGLLAMNAATVGAALRGVILTLPLNGRANVPALVVRDETATLSLSFVGPDTVGIRPVLDFSLAIAFNVMRALCGPAWVPSDVMLPYRPPENRRPYSRFFKGRLHFNADRSALTFPAVWLSRRIGGADAATHKALQQGIAAMMSQMDLDIETRVRRAVFAGVIQADVSVEAVSRMLGMHRRTLNRRLAERGTTLAAVLNTVRFELARRLMENTALPLSDIAATLHYADASAFTRAFRGWSGMTPSQWRDRSAG